MSDFHNDLIAVQSDLPALQKTAQNPHFKNKFVPLDEILNVVVPILNKHNFVLLQMPSIVDGEPALTYQIVHTSGETIGNTMLLNSAKGDPQGQGSAITYARRYSLMALLGLTADADDDGDSAPRSSSVSKDLASDKQTKMMFALWKQCTTDAQFSIYKWVQGRHPHAITEGDGQPHWGRLTLAEASVVIDQLNKAPKGEEVPA